MSWGRRVWIGLLAFLAAGGWYALCFARVEGRTVLMQAAHEGDGRLVRLLMMLGADVNAIDRGPRTGGNTALTFAARRGAADIVRALLNAGADPNPPNSPLCAATLSETGTVELLELLLVRGARIQEADGTSILRCLGAGPQRGNRAAFLISHGADANSLQAPGLPMVVAAASAGWIDVVEILLANGADINARGQGGRTALMAAAAAAQTDTVRFLVNRGADPTLRDDAGRTALGIAWSASEDVRQLRHSGEFRDIVALLAAAPADGPIRDRGAEKSQESATIGS